MIERLSIFPTCFALLLLSIAAAQLARADGTADATERLAVVSLREAGFDPKPFEHIDNLVDQGINDGEMPGCVIAIGRRNKLCFLKAYGHRQLVPEKIAMTTDTVFDLASITKPVATATSVMILIEREKLDLHEKVSTYLPEFGVNGKEETTLLHLLTHQSGLIPDNSLRDYADGRDMAFARIDALKARSKPGTKFSYSDVGFLVLARLVEAVSQRDVHRFSQENIFQKLGMAETTFQPTEGLKRRAAVTQQRNGQWMKGEVHDPRAHALEGIAGHAGLFSTAQDLAIYASTMLSGGSHHDRLLMKQKTIDLMTADYPVSGGIRGLGWDKQTGYSSNRAQGLSGQAFGHGGFTGTVIWIDPQLDLFYIFLSSRLHPDGKGSVNRLAAQIGTIAVDAMRVK